MLEVVSLALAISATVISIVAFLGAERYFRKSLELSAKSESALDTLRTSMDAIVSRTLDAALNRRMQTEHDLTEIAHRLGAVKNLLDSLKSGDQTNSPAQKTLDSVDSMLTDLQTRVRETQLAFEPASGATVAEGFRKATYAALQRADSPLTLHQVSTLAHVSPAIAEESLKELKAEHKVEESQGRWKINSSPPTNKD